ncbi:HAD-IIA family hydrolase [Krasilnikoviella flava]|uniref:HAD-superfamily subfamily IIA hydrolase, TIGR01458 n=1 Tax=Krasilnikoviella flava TaxID=526729 RepID=A0A1T5KE09_9MICO|nr:HAD hydrolase-like protein [Krasilnikoviella flava]SKC61921.1 HAD-superfamily subfamily IIA hydrolase, TIGR01458 [Krasilnikoviella flava]
MNGHAVLLDLQGTVYEGDDLVAGADDAVAALREAGHAVRFVTNTDSQDSASIVARLRGMGLRIEPAELFTPVDAAVALLAGPEARVHVLATGAVRDQLTARLAVVGPEDGPTHVLVGDVHDVLDYPALDAAFRAVLGGAELLALQHGRWFLRGGRPALDTGSVVAAIEHGAEVAARTLGKPSTGFLRLALGTISPAPGPDRTWVVGDDRSSDVAMGRAAGVRTVLVRTGKFARQADDDSLPHAEHVLDDLTGLPDLLGRA